MCPWVFSAIWNLFNLIPLLHSPATVLFPFPVFCCFLVSHVSQAQDIYAPGMTRQYNSSYAYKLYPYPCQTLGQRICQTLAIWSFAGGIPGGSSQNQLQEQGATRHDFSDGIKIQEGPLGDSKTTLKMHSVHILAHKEFVEYNASSYRKSVICAILRWFLCSLKS